jgi:hypothetical protein
MSGIVFFAMPLIVVATFYGPRLLLAWSASTLAYLVATIAVLSSRKMRHLLEWEERYQLLFNPIQHVAFTPLFIFAQPELVGGPIYLILLVAVLSLFFVLERLLFSGAERDLARRPWRQFKQDFFADRVAKRARRAGPER